MAGPQDSLTSLLHEIASEPAPQLQEALRSTATGPVKQPGRVIALAIRARALFREQRRIADLLHQQQVDLTPPSGNPPDISWGGC